MVDDLSFNWVRAPSFVVLAVNLASAIALFRLPRSKARREIGTYAAASVLVVAAAIVALSVCASVSPMFAILALPAGVAVAGLPAVLAVKSIRRLRSMTWERGG